MQLAKIGTTIKRYEIKRDWEERTERNEIGFLN